MRNLPVCWKAQATLCQQTSIESSCGLHSGHVGFRELDCKEVTAPKNWCLWTVVLEKSPKSPPTSQEINQPILKEINPEYSLKGLMLKLKLQYFGHLMRTTNSLEKSLMLGNIEGRRRRGCQRVTDGITHAWTGTWANSRRCSGTGKPGLLQSMGLQRVRHDWATTYSSMEFSSVQFSHSVMFDSLRPHGLQYTRPPRPSPTPGACSNSYPSSWWCHPIISSSVIPFSCLQSFPSIRVFSSESVLHIRWPKYWSYSFSISPSSEYSWLISFRVDWFDLLSVLAYSLQYGVKNNNSLQFSCLENPMDRGAWWDIVQRLTKSPTWLAH